MKTSDLKSAINAALIAVSFVNHNGVVVAPVWVFDNDPTQAPVNKAAWISVRVEVTNTKQISLGSGTGSRRIRKSGLVLLTIHTKLDMGSGLSDHIASEIEDSMSNVSIGGVVYRASEPGLSIRSKELEGYWQQNLDLPFYADRFQ